MLGDITDISFLESVGISAFMNSSWVLKHDRLHLERGIAETLNLDFYTHDIWLTKSTVAVLSNSELTTGGYVVVSLLIVYENKILEELQIDYTVKKW